MIVPGLAQTRMKLEHPPLRHQTAPQDTQSRRARFRNDIPKLKIDPQLNFPGLHPTRVENLPAGRQRRRQFRNTRWRWLRNRRRTFQNSCPGRPLLIPCCRTSLVGWPFLLNSILLPPGMGESESLIALQCGDPETCLPTGTVVSYPTQPGSSIP